MRWISSLAQRSVVRVCVAHTAAADKLCKASSTRTFHQVWKDVVQLMSLLARRSGKSASHIRLLQRISAIRLSARRAIENKCHPTKVHFQKIMLVCAFCSVLSFKWQSECVYRQFASNYYLYVSTSSVCSCRSSMCLLEVRLNWLSVFLSTWRLRPLTICMCLLPVCLLLLAVCVCLQYVFFY